MKNHIIVLLKSFEMHIYFSIEMLWTTFALTKDSPIDPMQKGDN